MILTGAPEASRANRDRRSLPNGAVIWRSELITVEGGAQVVIVQEEGFSVLQAS